MKKLEVENQIEALEDDFEIDIEELEERLRPRPKDTVALEMPIDALETLKKVAEKKEMSFQALLRYYIGQGLQQDLARMFSENVLETTRQVLAKHITSEEEVSKIMQEIKFETKP